MRESWTCEPGEAGRAARGCGRAHAQPPVRIPSGARQKVSVFRLVNGDGTRWWSGRFHGIRAEAEPFNDHSFGRDSEDPRMGGHHLGPIRAVAPKYSALVNLSPLHIAALRDMHGICGSGSQNGSANRIEFGALAMPHGRRPGFLRRRPEIPLDLAPCLGLGRGSVPRVSGAGMQPILLAI